MCYVALSRVQCLEQLFILEKLPVDKMKPWPDAVEEMHRLDDIDRKRKRFSKFSICTLNVNSFSPHYQDITVDRILTEKSVICLQETWLSVNDNPSNFPIGIKLCHFNSVRKGAGIATYFNESFKHLKDFSAVSYQISVFASNDQVVVNIYRSKFACTDIFLKNLSTVVIDRTKEFFVCADWNICAREEKNHPILQFLSNNNFTPVIQPPKATQREGRCIDMIWTRGIEQQKYASHIDFKYYTDHGQISLMKIG